MNPIAGFSPVFLHFGADHYWFIPKPAESHHVFGAGFLLIGFLMVTENLSGQVWYESKLRKMIFPATLVLLGWGMIAVTFMEPNARLVHFAMGLPMTIGGWAENRYRSGLLPRRYVDAFLIPSLVFAGIDTAFWHLSPPITSGGFITHGSLAVTAIVIAGLRLYQSYDLKSVLRGVYVSLAVIGVGFELYIDAIFQRT